jgi:HD-GYP domain-containing protein (c-di-GMP phosphodiesterase class II)
LEGHALRAAYLGARLAADLGLGDDARSDLLYAGLLRDAGSPGLLPEGHPERGRPIVTGGRGALGLVRRGARAGEPRHLSRCDRAAALVRVLDLPSGVLEAVTWADERWDGRGPRHQRGAAIPLGGRILALAGEAAGALLDPGATEATVERALRRARGHALDPHLVERALALGRAGLWTEASGPALPERLAGLEPIGRVRTTGAAGLDTLAGAFADLVDTRTPRMGRHGRRVAWFAEAGAIALGLDQQLVDDVRRAALFHDLGRLLVPVAILEKPGPLSEAERHLVGEHAARGAAVLARSRLLAPLAGLVAVHHEPLDGRGNLAVDGDEDRAVAARIIALADRYEAMTAERPWRPAMSPAAAWAALREEVREPVATVVLTMMERTITELGERSEGTSGAN